MTVVWGAGTAVARVSFSLCLKVGFVRLGWEGGGDPLLLKGVHPIDLPNVASSNFIAFKLFNVHAVLAPLDFLEENVKALKQCNIMQARSCWNINA